MPRNSLLSVYGILQPGILMPRWNGRIHLLVYGMILIRYLICGWGHIRVFFFSAGCCRSMLAARVIGETCWCWDKEWCWPVSLLSALTMVTGKLYWKYVLDPLLPISQIGQAALLQAFRPCGTENMETVKTDLENLIKKKKEVIMTLLFPLMWPVILTQSWTGLEINPILEIPIMKIAKNLY